MAGALLERMCPECGGKGWFTHPNTISRCAVCKGTGSFNAEEYSQLLTHKAALDLLAELKLAKMCIPAIRKAEGES